MHSITLIIDKICNNNILLFCLIFNYISYGDYFNMSPVISHPNADSTKYRYDFV